jgi:hypothetical protein
VLYDWHNAVVGVATGDMGIAKDGSRKPSFTPGVDLMARLTLFGEGARGSLSEVRGSWGVVRGQGWQCSLLMCASCFLTFLYFRPVPHVPVAAHLYLLHGTRSTWVLHRHLSPHQCKSCTCISDLHGHRV